MNRLSRSFLFVLGVLLLSCILCPAQSSSKKKSGSSGSGSSGGSSSGGSSAQANTAGSTLAADGPFSIETEMFTYKAVEENGQIIACDIARYLYQGEVVDAPQGSHAPCAISGGSQSTPGIILVSSDSTLFSDFQLWRTDMATMSSLEARADHVCVVPEAKAENGQDANGAPHIKARGLLSGAASLSVPGQAASAAGTIMSLFSKNESVSSVVGTVENPALLNEVARQLRALNVLVIVPELYNPNALGGVDYSNSPYLKNLDALSADYDKCQEAKIAKSEAGGESAKPAASADIDSLLGSMESFLKTSLGAQAPGAPANPDEPAGAQSSPNVPVSHLTAALSADEVARQIGFSGNGASGSNATWQHVLWLKALESGGSVNHHSSLFGSKVTFGGGAVDTFAVFRMNGQLVCSGNVYNFQPPVGIKGLEKAFHARPADDPAKPFMLHSTCALLPPSS
ncbi:MAG TPA: hypothetical protein VHZ25_02245 [Acidobacteriaceae bacterium]|jgi:hypothetical protein|nr:hypothetical protein [Acidobacteriaceae bacterium]